MFRLILLDRITYFVRFCIWFKICLIFVNASDDIVRLNISVSCQFWQTSTHSVLIWNFDFEHPYTWTNNNISYSHGSYFVKVNLVYQWIQHENRASTWGTDLFWNISSSKCEHANITSILCLILETTVTSPCIPGGRRLSRVTTVCFPDAFKRESRI